MALKRISFVVLIGWLFSGCTSQPEKATLSRSGLQQAEALLQRLEGEPAEKILDLDPKPTDWRWRLAKAEALNQQRETAKALEWLASEQPLPDPGLETLRLMHTSWALSHENKMEAAEKTMLSAYSMAQKAPNREALEALLDIRYAVGVLLARGDLQSAHARVERSLAYASKANDPWLEQYAHGNRSFLFIQEYRFEEALAELEKVSTLLTKDYSAGSAARLEQNLGYTYLSLGDLERSIIHHKAAILAAKQAGIGETARRAAVQIASARMQLGQVEEALQSHEQTMLELRATKDRQSYWGLLNLAEAQLEVGKHQAAATSLAESQKDPVFAGDIRAVAMGSLLQGRIWQQQGQAQQAEKQLDGVARTDNYDRVFRLEALRHLGALHLAAGRPTQTRVAFARAIALQTARQKQSNSADVSLSLSLGARRLTEDIVEFEMQAGDWQRALGFVVSNRLPDYGQAGGPPSRSVSFAAMKEYAKRNGSVLLVYFMGAKRGYVWAISPQGDCLRGTFAGRKAMRENLSNFLASVDHLRNPLDLELPAKAFLQQALLSPVLPALQKSRRLLVVPDDTLSSFNFEMLPSPLDAKRFLLEDYTVEIGAMPSRLFGRPLPAKKIAKELLIAGNPDDYSAGFPRLPRASAEIAEITKLSGASASNALILQGDKCRRSQIMAAPLGDFRRLHFAMHAAANTTEPLRSALIMKREPNGGTVLAEDILQWKLASELVTLSACRSAGARAFSGEGLIGLAWSFMHAGAKNVVAGLWNVDDESTYQLMVSFYSHLAKNEPEAQALRQAKLELLGRSPVYRKPYYWAAFQLYRGSR